MRKPTMEDVAKRAGVSRALVSLALSGSSKVSDASRRAVLEASAELGYRPNLMARTLASRRTMTIGVLLDDLHNPFYADVADGLLTSATEHGYRVLLTAGLRQGETQKLSVDTLLQLHADGVILVSPRFSREEIEQRALHVPFVVVGEPLEAGLIDAVMIDETAAVGDAISYLYGLGHRDIAHVDGGAGAASSVRRASYENTMRRLGLDDRIHVVPGEFTERAGYEAAGRFGGSDGSLPTAVFAANDLIAAGLLSGLEDRGLRVPDDVSIVGFDNVYYSSMSRLSLTTVHQPRFEMGRRAVETLVERLEGGRTEGRRITLPTELVVRKSTAAPRPTVG